MKRLWLVVVSLVLGAVAGIYLNETRWGFGHRPKLVAPQPLFSPLGQTLIPAGQTQLEFLFPEKKEWKVRVSEVRTDLEVMLPRGWIARMDVRVDGVTGRIKQFEYTPAPPSSDSIDLWFAPSEKVFFLVTDGVAKDLEFVKKGANKYGDDVRILLVRPESPAVEKWQKYLNQNLKAAPPLNRVNQ